MERREAMDGSATIAINRGMGEEQQGLRSIWRNVGREQQGLSYHDE